MIFSGDLLHELSQAITKHHIIAAFEALVILVVGLFIARKASQAVVKLPNLDTQQKLFLRKLSYYIMVTLVLAASMRQLGFDLGVLLGAAGVLTVAVGFAAQTSASNLISGLFLMIDRPFVVGDFIQVGDIKGEVFAVDLLSCKIRTFDNVLVRIPNEAMQKSNILNTSYFPIRRVDTKLLVSFTEKLPMVESVLMSVADRNPLCLSDPKPLFLVLGFGDSGVQLQFSVWTLSGNMVVVTNRLFEEIRTAFAEAKIEIPFPTRVVNSWVSKNSL